MSGHDNSCVVTCNGCAVDGDNNLTKMVETKDVIKNYMGNNVSFPKPEISKRVAGSRATP